MGQTEYRRVDGQVEFCSYLLLLLLLLLHSNFFDESGQGRGWLLLVDRLTA